MALKFQAGNVIEDPRTIRAVAVLTNAYVRSTIVDLKGYNSVAVRVLVGTTQSGKTCSTKFQWSSDGTNFTDEVVLVNGTASGGELPQTYNSRRVDIDMAAANSYIERFNRLARFFAVAVKSDATTTGTISITAAQMNS